MKQYKLIKEYPGSPTLGYIITPNIGAEYYYSSFPEFWQQVVEKEYEILSYISKDNKVMLHAPFLENSETFYKTSGYKIYSIKRLSDGEVFTVGDNVQLLDWNTINTKINTILLNNNNNVYFEIIQDKNIASYETKKLKNWRKVKKPLFTTEDGVEIYKGGKFCSVMDYTLHSIDKTAENVEYRYDLFKFFSTKEAAEEYILMNKPCLSINDVMKNYYSHSKYIMSTKLAKLVKEKL